MNDYDDKDYSFESPDEFKGKYYEKEEQIKSAIFEPSVTTNILKQNRIDVKGNTFVREIKVPFNNLNIRELNLAVLTEADYIYVQDTLELLHSTERHMLLHNINLSVFYRYLYGLFTTTLAATKSRKGIALKGITTQTTESIQEYRKTEEEQKGKKKSLFDKGRDLLSGEQDY
jgi:hypothetical protein